MLVLTFLLAAFDVIVCIVRIAFLQRALLRTTLRNRLQGSSIPVDSDITYGESSAFMWSAVEVNIGIVCACIITLKPLVARVFPGILEGSKRESTTVGRTDTIPESHIPTGLSPPSFLRDMNINHPAPNMPVNTSHFDRSVSYSSTAYSAQAGDNSALEFITTPEMTNISSYSGRALVPQEPRLPSRRLFGCFNISLASKRLINLSAKESYLPIALMTILSFLLKFAYEVMNIHAVHILPILQMSQLRGVQFQATYFCGYFVTPLLITQYTLKKFSFHTSLLAGLLIFATAPMIFWPSIILLSVPGLILSYLVLGLGLSAVFHVIFTFVSLWGPFQYSVLRFLFSQGVGNIGQLLSIILTAQYFFPANPSETAILNSQWAFLAISLFFVFLAVFLYYIYLPEVSDEALICDAEYIAGVHQRCKIPWRKESICKWDVVYTTLTLGVFSAFCYSGASSVVTYFFPDYVRSMTPTSGLKDYHVAWIAGSTLIIGQFVTAMICYYVRPSWVLLLWCSTYIILSTLTITVEGTSGVVIMVVQQLFEGSIFPLLFTISLNGLGRHTKAASAYLTATLSAGALFIPVTYFVQKRPSANPIQYSFCVVLACSCFGLVMPLFINISRAARRQVNRLR
jgi:fucose permease